MGQTLQLKLIFLIILIPLYYIVGDNSIYLYVLALSLYNIFSACFSKISIKETINEMPDDYTRYKIFKLTLLIICVVGLVFLILGILISDIIGNLLNINNSFMTFFLMGISVLADPLTKIFLEYLDVCNYKRVGKIIYNIYCYLNGGLFLLVALIVFRGIEISEDVMNASLFLPKIISALIVNLGAYMLLKRRHVLKKKSKVIKVDYKQRIMKIINEKHLEKLVEIVKEIYYYVSIIILYLMLSKRYSYMLDDTMKIISFVYLYALSFINILIEIIIKKSNGKVGVLSKIYYIFDKFLSLAIILGIISPLICKVVFNNSQMAIYLMMVSFLGIFIALYNITFKHMSNYKLGYFSLGFGIITKFILIVPLIDSFYRMGYNLVYGDIISTIIGMCISIIINYIYFKNKEKEEKYFEKLLKSLYENIFLCIFLVIMQFIIPVTTEDYFKSLLLIFVYGYISVIFMKFKGRKWV